MARLKRNELQKQQTQKEQGELITREDGTQVVRVRRRKRRSKQPQKSKPKTNPKFKWAMLGSFVLVVIVALASTVFIIAKYNGSSFKTETETNISNISGAQQVELTQLRVTPVSAKAQKIELTWDNHHFLRSAVFHHLDADILATSFLGSEWDGEEIVSPQGEIRLQTPETAVESGNDPIISPYQFDSYRCNQLNLYFGRGKSAPAILGLQASYWNSPNDKSKISYSNGRIKVNDWPELEISSGVATLNQNDLEIEALLEAGNAHKGEISIKGRITKETKKPIVLDVRAKNYPIQDLLGKGLGRIIRGEINSEMGSLQYDYKQPASKALKFIMPFNSGDIQLTELPMLDVLKDITGDTQYVRPVFNHCNGTLIRTSSGITIDDIDFKSSSVINLTGKISVDINGRISGEMVIGLPRRLFDPTNIPPGFSGPRDGLYHANITLSGTIHNPHDNLKDILMRRSSVRQVPNMSAPPTTRAEKTPDLPLSKEEKEKEFKDLVR